MTRRSAARATCLIVTIGTALIVLAGCTGRPESFAPVSSRGRSISDLFLFILALSGVVMLLLVGVLAYLLIRFRNRPGAPAPSPIRNNAKLQIAWIVAPVLLFAGFTIPMVRTMDVVDAPASGQALQIRVIGNQWWWEFRYPDSDVVTANELHIPVGQPLRLEITGADVIHSFWVPEFGWKMDGIPGRDNTMAVEVDRPGVYDGACTEFCGAQHAWMRIRVVAEPPAEFDGWDRPAAADRQPIATGSTIATRWPQGVFRGEHLHRAAIPCNFSADGSATAESPVGPGSDALRQPGDPRRRAS